MGRLGGWDFKRREIQIQQGVKQGRVFILAHELMHAELAFSYEERPEGCFIEGILEMEEVVHSATERCLEEMGVGGYREFCTKTGREYRSLAQLQTEAPRLGLLSEWLSGWCAIVWQGEETDLSEI